MSWNKKAKLFLNFKINARSNNFSDLRFFFLCYRRSENKVAITNCRRLISLAAIPLSSTVHSRLAVTGVTSCVVSEEQVEQLISGELVVVPVVGAMIRATTTTIAAVAMMAIFLVTRSTVRFRVQIRPARVKGLGSRARAIRRRVEYVRTEAVIVRAFFGIAEHGERLAYGFETLGGARRLVLVRMELKS